MSQGPAWRRPVRYRFYSATVILIAINVGIFLLIMVAPRIFGYVALTPILVVQANAWWQVVTYMFVHDPTWIWHLLFNMLALYVFGLPLERKLGSGEFLSLYFVTGIGAGLATLAVNWYSGMGNIPVVGASGAIFGVMLAFATYFPDVRILLFGIFPIRAPLLVLGYAAFELFSLLGRRNLGVAHLTHLSGLLIGYLYLLVRLRVNPLRVFFHRR